MEIEEIFPPYIYSVRYAEYADNEFDRLLDMWNDTSEITCFLNDNIQLVTGAFWRTTPENMARQILDEAEELEDLFDEYRANADANAKPDFDNLFRYLEGKYKYETKHFPMKSYGPQRPSLIRLYAIKMGPNCYLITGGGIKLADTIQNSPDLKDHVLQNIDRVRDYLKANGIMDGEDL